MAVPFAHLNRLKKTSEVHSYTMRMSHILYGKCMTGTRVRHLTYTAELLTQHGISAISQATSGESLMAAQDDDEVQ